MEISNKILAILRDIANDPEFQFDYKLGNDIESNLNFILSNKEVLEREIKLSIGLYKEDIELLKFDGLEYGDLIIILDELELYYKLIKK